MFSEIVLAGPLIGLTNTVCACNLLNKNTFPSGFQIDVKLVFWCKKFDTNIKRSYNNG
jgi:hypothetical protein